jgi:uncharacterized DUF497 family protein
MDFEWDEAKAQSNLIKHGVPFTEAGTVFGDPLAVTFYDPDNSVGEDRFLTIGLSAEGRVIILTHADRGEKIRIISAREATRGERRGYEDGRFP